MQYQYRTVHIYADIKDNLIIVPTARSEKWGGATMEIDLITQLNLPYSDEELEEALKKALEQCHSKAPNDDLKITVMETFLNVKGYSKAVKDKKLINFNWRIDEGYKITPTQKIPKKGYVHLKDKEIMLGQDLKTGELARAVKEAISISTP